MSRYVRVSQFRSG